MGAVIAILTSLAVLIFWLSRAAANAHHIKDAANEISNLPRKRRFQKASERQGLDLIESPQEAATILMIAMARLTKDGRVTDAETQTMIEQLANHMGLGSQEASDFIDHLRWLTRDLKQADSVLPPMVNLLRNAISRQEAEDLAAMLTEVSMVSGAPNSDQIAFLRRYREYLGLNAPA